jgi:hypothetical protein
VTGPVSSALRAGKEAITKILQRVSQLTLHPISYFTVFVQQQIGEGNHRDSRRVKHGNEGGIGCHAGLILARFFKHREAMGPSDAKRNVSFMLLLHGRLF